ncbi:hypothetical protein ACFL6B_01580 [Thermodesulfobacteriota bacterium]
MNIKKHGTLALVVAFVLLVNIPMGCGNSNSKGLSMQDVPRYPNATEVESMEQSSLGGLVGGKLAQFTTTDSFDEVLDFYADALNKYNPEHMSHTSELGRQTAISIPQKNGMISIAIQEFTEEEKVNITLMAVGG